MFPLRARPAVCGLVVLALTASRGFAGGNAGGQAFLSWDRAGVVTSLNSVPATSFPLYLHLHNAPDIRALAVWIKWTPFDSTNRCYDLVPDPASAAAGAYRDSACGLGKAVNPHSDFAGDTTYSWSIVFPAGAVTKDLAAYLVASPMCENPPAAIFEATSVLTMDSNGLVDTLSLGADATISPAPSVTQVEPARLEPGIPTLVSLHGANFAPGARVTLHSGATDLEGGQVVVQDSSNILAQVRAPAALARPLDVVLSLPDGRLSIVPSAITVAGAVAQNPTPMRPSDDAEAFQRIALQSPILQRNLQTGVNLLGTASYLTDPNLLVTRSPADTVGLFTSQPHNGVGVQSLPFAPWQVAFGRYNIGSRPASSIGLLALGGIVMNGPGGWNDFGKSLLKIVTRYADGDSTVDSLGVGLQIRNYVDGVNGCSTTYPTYIAPPTDTLAGQVWTGSYNGSQWFYDVQERQLPEGKRAVPIQDIELRSDSIFHNPENNCGLWASSAIFGMSLWNRFSVTNAAGQHVALQSQNDVAWSGDPYGGYVYNDTLVGEHRTIGELGCFLACLSMANNFYGVACTPRSLNQFLQSQAEGDGYTFQAVFRITAVVDDSVAFDIVDPTATIGPTFLIQDGRLSPRATVGVRGAAPGGSSGWGMITQRFRGGDVRVGDWGVVYDEPNFIAGSKKFSSNKWKAGGYFRPPTAALVESTLAVNSLAFLYTAIDSAGAKHWVVADGREPAFVSASEAKGTYSIKDPGYLDASSMPLRRLLQAPHNNMFQDALACSLVTAQRARTIARAQDMADPPVLAIRLQGAGVLDVTDPAGNTIRYDTGTGAYVSGVPNAIAIRRFRIVAPTDSAVHTGIADAIQIDGAASGAYVVTVSGESGGSFILSAEATGGTGATSNTITSGDLTGGSRRYVLNYSTSAVSTTDVTAVEPTTSRPERLSLQIHPNPALGTVQFDFNLERASMVALDVFDIQGRRVATILSGVRAAGWQSVRWDGGTPDGVRVRAGVYFARLDSDRRWLVKRMVVMQ